MMALACGFLVATNLHLMPQSRLHIVLNLCPANSLPRSILIFLGQGHLLSHCCSTMLATEIALLSLHSAISNQPVAGSIIVTASSCKGFSLLLLLLPDLVLVVLLQLMVCQGPVKSTQSSSQGTVSVSLTRRCPCFFL